MPATTPYGNAPPMPAPVASMGAAQPTVPWPARRNGLAAASMALGILSTVGLVGLVAAFGVGARELAGLSVAGALLAPMAFILGLVANHQIQRDRSRGFGMAVTGITMGCSVTVAVLFVLATI